MCAPRQRFVADPDAAARCAVREFVKLRRYPGVVIDCVGRDTRADQHERSAQLRHHVELAFSAIEIASQLFVGNTFKVAKWLEQIDGKAEVGGLNPHVAPRSGRKHQVVLKDLHAREMSRSNRVEFLLEGAAEANRRNGSLHVEAPVIWIYPSDFKIIQYGLFGDSRPPTNERSPLGTVVVGRPINPGGGGKSGGSAQALALEGASTRFKEEKECAFFRV
jgi:hypothetical protein